MASLDLSAAFDIVNVQLLLKRFKILGMPTDLINLIEVWLTECKFYVEVDGVCSRIYESNDGTIQGSVLGPILYAIFVSPLFDLTNLTNFADDNFIIEFNSQINALIADLEKKLEFRLHQKSSDIDYFEAFLKIFNFKRLGFRKLNKNGQVDHQKLNEALTIQDINNLKVGKFRLQFIGRNS